VRNSIQRRREIVQTALKTGKVLVPDLVDAGRIEVLMTCGTLRNKSLSFYGRQAEESLQRYHFDKVILGVDGFDFHAGITTRFEYEAIMNRLMCDVALRWRCTTTL
jgi:DeoR family transcriptional regulator of aga operon